MRLVIGSLLVLVAPMFADTYPVIIRGTVTMEDGSAPPFTVGVERICSDSAGSAPGPITNKKGEWSWRIEIDPFASRACLFRATHPGYSSTTQDASNINTTSRNTTVTLPPLVLNAVTVDPGAIVVSESNIPAKAKGSFDKAMKALDTPDFAEASKQLEAAVAGSPKFAQGWHTLGVVDERMHKQDEAKAAYQHAIDADPKMFSAYVMLARVCIKMKDWQGAGTAADSLIKADSKKTYPEIYLHRAVARYALKDIAGAEESAQEALRLDPKHKKPRGEYILGRILEAKGDASGAREHITKYLALEPAAPDADIVRAHLEGLGKSDSAGVDPELEPL
jgi:Flp pilus assembly protein TadD